LPNWCGYREQASPTKCGKNIVGACLANDRQTTAAGSGVARASIFFPVAKLPPELPPDGLKQAGI